MAESLRVRIGGFFRTIQVDLVDSEDLPIFAAKAAGSNNNPVRKTKHQWWKGGLCGPWPPLVKWSIVMNLLTRWKLFPNGVWIPKHYNCSSSSTSSTINLSTSHPINSPWCSTKQAAWWPCNRSKPWLQSHSFSKNNPTKSSTYPPLWSAASRKQQGPGRVLQLHPTTPSAPIQQSPTFRRWR